MANDKQEDMAKLAEEARYQKSRADANLQCGSDLAVKLQNAESSLARVRGLLQRQWISVEERLPDGGQVLIAAIRANGERTVQDGYYLGDGDWTVEDQGFAQKPIVTHWQPLPTFQQPSLPVASPKENL